MAVVIRMKRTGRRNRPCYRITVADSQKPRDGRTIETIGQYDPASPVEGLRIAVNVERARHWLALGALPSVTVHTVFKGAGVYQEGELVKKRRSRPERKNETARSKRRAERKKDREARKSARRDERVQAKAAAKAAAAESSDSDA